MSRLKKGKISLILLFLISCQYIFIGIGSYGHAFNKISRISLLDSTSLGQVVPNNDMNEAEPIKDRVDPALKELSGLYSSDKMISIVIESNQGELAKCIKDFEDHGIIENLLNYSHFSGFSAIIKNDKLTNLMNDLPNSIKYIEENSKAEITLKDSLEQLRIFPYIRNNYSLKGDINTSVAILDAGMDPSHPALKDKVIYWKDFQGTNWENATDYRAHGTAIGSIACGNPYNTTDVDGRTLKSDRYYYDWSQISLDPSKKWKYYTSAVNLSTNGNITLEGSWFNESDSTVSVKYFNITNYSNISVAHVSTEQPSKIYNCTFEINDTNHGIYKIVHVFELSANGNDAYGINLTLHVPENNTELENLYSGVAPNCKIVALRCITGGADLDEIIAAMNWVLENKSSYNITSVIMSFKITSTTVRVLADAMVSAGIVVSCAAGNDYPYNQGNTAGSSANSPGSADKVISVGAINHNSSITSYSSAGGWNPTGHVMKPDIVAPGGVSGNYNFNNTPIFCADSNDGEYLSHNITEDYEDMKDVIANDTRGVSGTSFAAPFVAGVSQLIIEALGGRSNWNYTEQEALFVKNLLLLTATETYPNERLYIYPQYKDGASPVLNRGTKDVHEGYGKINPDAAIDALMNEMKVNSTNSSMLFSIPTNKETQPYCWARKIYLPRNFYNISLEVPDNADFDLYVYKYQGDQYGEPIIQGKSVNASLGADEILINHTIQEDNYYFVVVKGVNGSGQFNISIHKSPKYYDKIAPACKILLPLNYSYLNETIIIRGNATDDYSGIKSVSIIITTPTRQEIFVQTDPDEVFTISWISKKIDNGNCSIYIIASDYFNNTATSKTIIITIFNENIPPVIKWISPLDQSIITGSVLISANITDQHTQVANFSLFFLTSHRNFTLYFNYTSEIFQYSWLPLLDDDGTCYIIIEAWDIKENIGKSETLLIILRNVAAFNNIVILTFIITILAMTVASKVSKKLLTNEKILKYLEDLSDYIKKPSRERLKKVNPLIFLRKRDILLSKISEINQFISEKKYRKALSSCNYLLKWKRATEYSRLLTDIKMDLEVKLIENIKKTRKKMEIFK